MSPITVPVALLVLATAAAAPVGPSPSAAQAAAASLNHPYTSAPGAEMGATNNTNTTSLAVAEGLTTGSTDATDAATAASTNATTAAAATTTATITATARIAISRRDRRDWEENDWGDDDWGDDGWPGPDIDIADKCDSVVCPAPAFGTHHDFVPCCPCGSSDTLCQEQKAAHDRGLLILFIVMAVLFVAVYICFSCVPPPPKDVTVVTPLTAYTPLPTYGAFDQWSSKPIGPATGYPPTMTTASVNSSTELPRNLAGDPMSWGKDRAYRHSLYCGKNVGRSALAPGSNGRCGPSNGPRCANCKPFS